MGRVLIVDKGKSSVVMTSEAVKDRVPGTEVVIAQTGEAALEILNAQKASFSFLIIDFDLPDTDAVTLTKLLRTPPYNMACPIFITAYPEKIVKEAIESELFTYHDSCMWIPKPVRFQQIGNQIDLFIRDKRRFEKRFEVDVTTLLVGKGAGRGKRAPKVQGQMVNVSIGGAMLSFKDSPKIKTGDEVTLSFDANDFLEKPKGTREPETLPPKMRAKITWLDRKKKRMGISFENLNETSRKNLEGFLKESKEIDIGAAMEKGA